MNKAELNSFKLDNADVITASTGGGEGDGLVHLFNFGDGKNNAIFTYGGEDLKKDCIYTAPESGIKTSVLLTALNNALGFERIIKDDTKFYGSGYNIAVSNLSIADPAQGEHASLINGAYEWVTDHFQKVE